MICGYVVIGGGEEVVNEYLVVQWVLVEGAKW